MVVFTRWQGLIRENLLDSINECAIVNEDVFADAVDRDATVCDAQIPQDGPWLHERLLADLVGDLGGVEKVACFLGVRCELIIPGDYLVLDGVAAHDEGGMH